ncbi:helix-turn-helix transcriptional regulator [Bradyrhizobium neotropicale]|uniref:ArsR/SmtB family transcription factor n=1 Tax=Bradyrhizobium neotropicale TaxID=1497615 RepID=UPI001AEFAC57|nr:helix-turn-helix domain-containing protein [Bradyrhizobium neotropicale]MBO4222638.1 helix-turn-helix domain-containing protein [Bradyrhizobium neotropicale]
MLIWVDDDQLDNVFKALGDPVRRRILDRLAKRPGQSLFEICASSVAEDGRSLSRQTISQHLDLLERAGLVQTHWSGRTNMHSFDTAPLRKAADAWLNKHLKKGSGT